MELASAFIGAPIVTYFAWLPRGRAAFVGSLVAMALAALLLVWQMGRADSHVIALTVLVISAIRPAGLVQIWRMITIGRGRPRWVYPPLLLLALLAAGLPTLNILGV